jgi:hypothetical protein
MSKEEFYTVYVDGVETHKNLTEDEYFDLMQDFAIEYYESQGSKPGKVTFKITQGD